MNARFTSVSSARKMPTSAAASHCSKSKPSNMETNELKNKILLSFRGDVK